MPVGGPGLAGLSQPAVFIQQHLGGVRGEAGKPLANPSRAGCAPGSFQRGSDDAHAPQRNPPPRKAHGTGICHRNLPA